MHISPPPHHGTMVARTRGREPRTEAKEGEKTSVDRRERDGPSRFIVKPLLSSSAVTHVVRGHFRHLGVVDIILGKRDQLQLLAPAGENSSSNGRASGAWCGGMCLIHQQPTHGTLTELRTIPCSAANKGGVHGADLIGALSDSGKLSIIMFDLTLLRFMPVRQLHLGSPDLLVAPLFSPSSPSSLPSSSAASPGIYPGGGGGGGGGGGTKLAARQFHSEGCEGAGRGDEGRVRQVFTKLAVEPRARCLAVACPTHVSLFFTSANAGENEELETGALVRSSSRSGTNTPDPSVRSPVRNTQRGGLMSFDSAGLPLRPKGCAVLDVMFAPTGSGGGGGGGGICLVLLLSDRTHQGQSKGESATGKQSEGTGALKAAGAGKPGVEEQEEASTRRPELDSNDTTTDRLRASTRGDTAAVEAAVEPESNGPLPPTHIDIFYDVRQPPSGSADHHGPTWNARRRGGLSHGSTIKPGEYWSNGLNNVDDVKPVSYNGQCAPSNLQHEQVPRRYETYPRHRYYASTVAPAYRISLDMAAGILGRSAQLVEPHPGALTASFFTLNTASVSAPGDESTSSQAAAETTLPRMSTRPQTAAFEVGSLGGDLNDHASPQMPLSSPLHQQLDRTRASGDSPGRETALSWTPPLLLLGERGTVTVTVPPFNLAGISRGSTSSVGGAPQINVSYNANFSERSCWAWDRVWAPNPLLGNLGLGSPRGAGTVRSGARTQGRWVWRLLVAMTGGRNANGSSAAIATRSTGQVQVAMAFDADGTVCPGDDFVGGCAALAGIEGPVAILPVAGADGGCSTESTALRRFANNEGGFGDGEGRKFGPETSGDGGKIVHPAAVVFGKSGAAAVVAVPLLRSAFLPVSPLHNRFTAATDSTSLLCGESGGGGLGGRIHVPPLAPITSLAPMPLPPKSGGASGACGRIERFSGCEIGGGDGIDSSIAAADTGAAEDSDAFVVAGGGTVSRVAIGVAAAVTPVSDPGFGSVTSIWNLRNRATANADSMIVLSFSHATRVFTVKQGGGGGECGGELDPEDVSTTFEEAADGAGLETGETTLACGRFGDGMVAQVTPKDARLCGIVYRDSSLSSSFSPFQPHDGGGGKCLATWCPGPDAGALGAATVSPHGRIALALPRRGSIVILACRPRSPKRQGVTRGTEAEVDCIPFGGSAIDFPAKRQLVALSEITCASEPSCLIIPSPFLAGVLLDCMNRTAPASIPTSRSLSFRSGLSRRPTASGAAPRLEHDDDTCWSMVLAGTYGRTLEAFVVRERDGGYDWSVGDEVPPLPGVEGTEVVCHTSLTLGRAQHLNGEDGNGGEAGSGRDAEELNSVGVPSSIHVALWKGGDKDQMDVDVNGSGLGMVGVPADPPRPHPVILVTTRSGALMQVEALPTTPDLQLPLPRPLPPPSPPPSRLLQAAAGGRNDGVREVEVVRVGVEGGQHRHPMADAAARTGSLHPVLASMMSPLERAFVDRKTSADNVERGEMMSRANVTLPTATGGAAAREVPLRLTFTRSLSSAPLSLVPLGDALEAAVVVIGQNMSWLVRGAVGCQRASVVRLDAPPLSAATAFTPPCFADDAGDSSSSLPSSNTATSAGAMHRGLVDGYEQGSGVGMTARLGLRTAHTLLSVTRGRLALVAPDLNQRDPAARSNEQLRTEKDSGTMVQFLCRDDVSGRAVAATTSPIPLISAKEGSTGEVGRPSSEQWASVKDFLWKVQALGHISTHESLTDNLEGGDRIDQESGGRGVCGDDLDTWPSTSATNPPSVAAATATGAEETGLNDGGDIVKLMHTIGKGGEGVHVTALAACQPPRGCVGGIIAVGSSAPTADMSRPRTIGISPKRAEGRLLLLRLIDITDLSSEVGDTTEVVSIEGGSDQASSAATILGATAKEPGTRGEDHAPNAMAEAMDAMHHHTSHPEVPGRSMTFGLDADSVEADVVTRHSAGRQSGAATTGDIVMPDAATVNVTSTKLAASENEITDGDPSASAPVKEDKKQQRGSKRTLGLAATVALPHPVTCIASAGPGMLFVGAGPKVYCIRITNCSDGGQIVSGLLGDSFFNPMSLSGTLSATLVAQTAVRHRVTAIAAGLPSFAPAHVGSHSKLSKGGRDDVIRGREGAGNAPYRITRWGRLPLGGNRGNREEEEAMGCVPVAIADDREGVSFSLLKTDDRDSGVPMEYPQFVPAAADPTVRTVLAVAIRRKGEVAGIDTAGRLFVLQNRNPPRLKEPQTSIVSMHHGGSIGDEGEGGGEGGTSGSARAAVSCSPERNLTTAASFTLSSSPSAMLLIPCRQCGGRERGRGGYEPSSQPTATDIDRQTTSVSAPSANEEGEMVLGNTIYDVEGAACFDGTATAVAAVAPPPHDPSSSHCSGTRVQSHFPGPSLLVGTREGGVVCMFEVSEEDWAVLQVVQARLEVHPMMAPVLGASHSRNSGTCPPRSGFGGPGFGPPAPLWPAPVAPASPPPHPTVIDGALLHELLELPDWAQRSILAGGGGGGCAGKTFDEDGSSPHVVAFFDSCDARSDIVPLPTEAVLELIHRVLET